MVKQKKLMPLPKQVIDHLFASEERAREPHQSNILIGLYKHIFTDWDEIKMVDGWPMVSKATAHYIINLFQAFDKKFHPEVMPAGIWLNKGMRADEHMKDWVADLSTCTIEYDD